MPDVDLPLPFVSYVGDEPYAFASYAHKDGRQVFPELRALNDQGVRIWYDEGIDPGNEWPDDIARALSGASVFLVFVSRAAVESRNVRNEINFALNRGKRFLAIYLEDVQLPPGLELRMGDIQAVMKFRMTAEHYVGKLATVLPSSVIRSDARATTARPLAPPAFAVRWTCRLKEVSFGQIRALVSTGRELLCISPDSADFWVQAVHEHNGKLLWQVTAGDGRLKWDRIAWSEAYLYLAGEVEVEPDLRFAKKFDLREGDMLASVSWYDVPSCAHQIRDKIPEWDQLSWRSVLDIEHQGQAAETAGLRVMVRNGRVHVQQTNGGAYDWDTPASDPVTAVTIQGESSPVVAFGSGRLCLLAKTKSS